MSQLCTDNNNNKLIQLGTDTCGIEGGTTKQDETCIAGIKFKKDSILNLNIVAW
jgi:hypothetical protein